MVSNPDLGSQVVVSSGKGLVVFDSFWSEVTARRFRKVISESLGRNDFSYVVNMADRLDMIGGNHAYPEAILVGQDNIAAKYCEEDAVKEELTELIEMWMEKEGYSRDRLQNMKPGSDEAMEEESWLKKCVTMADELEHSFSLVLPEQSYHDKMSLDLGDVSINLIWFGNSGNYKGLTMAVIPCEKLAIMSKAFVYPDFHLAPFPYPYYGELDVPQWISVLEQVLEGEDPVERIVLSDGEEVYPAEQLQQHLVYIRELWNSVKILEAQGRTLQEIQEKLSLDREFTFVKEMEVYKNSGDFWLRPQHEMHVKLFFLQGRNLASRILKEGGPESLETSLAKIKYLGDEVYFDEVSMDFLGTEWMNHDNIPEAIEVFELNAEIFPDSFSALNSLGTAYMRNGDTENAITNFKKSFALNPENRYAEEMLEELAVGK